MCHLMVLTPILFLMFCIFRCLSSILLSGVLYRLPICVGSICLSISVGTSCPFGTTSSYRSQRGSHFPRRSSQCVPLSLGLDASHATLSIDYGLWPIVLALSSLCWYYPFLLPSILRAFLCSRFPLIRTLTSLPCLHCLLPQTSWSRS